MFNCVKLLILFVLSFLFVACTTEQNYRGIPDATWKQLTPQQKQLIVDRSFQDEIADKVNK